MTGPGPIVVIGHVDHGKTALVKALTGTDTDRLPEEKQRGLSIALGFAQCNTGRSNLDIIDAPGHEDFIRTMIAGASGARAVLLVISAPDGLEAQTHEHLDIALRLGLSRGVVALTKIDLLPVEERAGRVETLAAQVCATGFSPKACVPCSSKTGEGLDLLAGALDQLDQTTPEIPALEGFVLPIDRVFSVHGAGTVVTGTLLGAPLCVGMDAEVGSDAVRAPIRGLQIHGQDADTAGPGQRVAVNLRGIPADAIARGDVLRAPNVFPASDRWHGLITLAANHPKPLKHMDRLRIMLGTLSEVVTVRFLESSRLAPGEAGLAELHLPRPHVSHAGQRGILRTLSPAATLGGVIVIDPAPPQRRRRDGHWVACLHAAAQGDVTTLAKSLAQRGKGAFACSDLARLSRRSFATAQAAVSTKIVQVDDQHWAFHEDADAASTALERAVRAYFTANPLRLCAPTSVLETADIPLALRAWAEHALVDAGLAHRRPGGLALSGRDPRSDLSADQRSALETLEETLRMGGAAPPDRADLIRDHGDSDALLTLLVDMERACALYNHALRRMVYLHTAAVTDAVARLRQVFPSPAAFKTGEARATLSTNRRVIVPLLEHLDREGITVRQGDLRTMAPDCPALETDYAG